MKSLLLLLGLGILAGCQEAPRYQVVPGSTEAIIYRLDTKTGDVRLYHPRGFQDITEPLPPRTPPAPVPEEP